jgi:ABC-type bacteriocin/lantibiotic exporter with double-glycine peptidase domain
MDRFPHYKQLDHMDCGPTCLRIITKFYGKTYKLETLRSELSWESEQEKVFRRKSEF